MVGIKMAHSAVNKEWTAADFPELSGITSIEDLTYADTEKTIAKYSEAEDFRQLLKLHITNTTKAAVIAGIDALEQNEKIYFAEPNAIINMEEPISAQEVVSTLSRTVSYSNESRYWDYTANDPRLKDQRGIYMHNIDKVWNAFTTGSSNVVIGVIDSGIYNHTDLSANLLPAYNCMESYTETTYVDPANHGTGVASIIGAVGNNSRGIAGVCHNIKIAPLRISDDPSGDASNGAIATAILRAHVNEIPIVNLSYSISDYNNTINLAVGIYDGLIVCSAGNGIDVRGVGEEITETNPLYLPSCDAENVIAVGSINHNMYLSSFSNYSDTFVDIMAYGESPLICRGANTYLYSDGTSYSAPYVAGVAALLLSYDNTLTTAQLKQYILDSAHQTDELEDYCVTGGYLDAYGAFLKMIGERSLSMNMQIQSVDMVKKYTFEIYHHPTYSKLTEIVLPENVRNDLDSISIDQTDDMITITLELLFPLNPGEPLIDIHFITYNSYSYVYGYTSLYSYQMTNDEYNININQHPPTTYALVGDVNGDGGIDSSDMLKIGRHISNQELLTGTNLVAADVNGDFVVDSADSALVGEYFLNKIYSFY